MWPPWRRCWRAPPLAGPLGSRRTCFPLPRGGVPRGGGWCRGRRSRAPRAEAPSPPRPGRCGTRPAPDGRAARAGEGLRGRAGAGRGAGPALSPENSTCPEGLRSAGHEDPVDGAVRAGAAVARGPGRLRRLGALLPRPRPRLLRPRLEAGQSLWDVLLRPSLPHHRRLLLRLCQGVPSSPVPGRGVEPLERLRGPVPADGARAEARGAAGASQRRRALPGPGGESRLPGVRDGPGPGLRARLRVQLLESIPSAHLTLQCHMRIPRSPPSPGSLHRKIMQITGKGTVPAFITSSAFNKERTRQVASPQWSTDIEDAGYCMEFKTESLTPHCALENRPLTRWMQYLREGYTVCVDCQPPAMNSVSLRCSGDGLDSDGNQTLRWQAVGSPRCQGTWKKVRRVERCSCPAVHSFIFI
ncbi:somatomedin-B and thrombospondin type-1 domain-containing protein isoform X1 [Camelus bactrianus]|uniref:Somatomedin-B and thrombospondin type-1 domain-containing protein isoform X1 n=1 Tax=Camelus bactrianus TaxID=9837 RepID=A0AC58PLS2_CAMBA